MTLQTQFTLRPRSRGFHLITDEVVRNLPPLPEAGLLHLFIQHTSAGLSINENADPDVQQDLAAIFDRLVRERESYYAHTLEGDDDMPAHAKSTLTGVSLTLPFVGGEPVGSFGGCGHGRSFFNPGDKFHAKFRGVRPPIGCFGWYSRGRGLRTHCADILRDNWKKVPDSLGCRGIFAYICAGGIVFILGEN